MNRKFRPLWAVALTDEFAMRRLEAGREIQRAVKEGRSLIGLSLFRPPVPDVLVRCSSQEISIELHNGNEVNQLSLGAVAAVLRGAGWVISNDYDQLSFERMGVQFKHYGVSALWPGKHWFIRKYRTPIILRKVDQRYHEGFDAFLGQCADEVGSNASIMLELGMLGKLSEKAVGGSLPPEEAREYFHSRR